MKIKRLVISILIPLLIGGLSALLTSNGMDAYKLLEKPALAPPAIVFPIVWSVLFILMGISSYLVYNSNNDDDKALTLYGAQLIFNFFWTIIFFGLKLRLLAFIWLIILIVLVILMIREFYKINKTSAYLQIPYLVWLLFAAYLNIAIYILNR